MKKVEGRSLLGEFWQRVILVFDELVLEKSLDETLMSHYCSLREEQDIQTVKLKLDLNGMESATGVISSSAKESGRAVSISINEFVEVLFYNSAGEAVEPLFHRLDFGTLEVDGESQEVIVRTSSKHDESDWMTATFQIT